MEGSVSRSVGSVETGYPSHGALASANSSLMTGPRRVARAIAGGHSPTLEQGVLADLNGEGHYLRHVRRVRALCAKRQQALLEAARRL
jgi:DNA-binding transcriptional MocR family regulator